MTPAVPSAPRSARLLVIVGGLVLAWFALAEVGNQLWYSIHESKLRKNPIPATGEEIVRRIREMVKDNDGTNIEEHDIGAAARDILDCLYGETVSWMDEGGGTAAATVLRWADRSSVGGIESSHNPGNCLAAAGWTIGDRAHLGFQDFRGITADVTEWQVSRPGIQMLAYSAVFRRFFGAAEIERKTSRNDLRLGTVWAGRRDAPILVMLIYLPTNSFKGDGKREEFRKIMEAALSQSAPQSQ